MLNKIKYLFISLALIVLNCNSQTANKKKSSFTDSILKIISEQSSDTTKARYYNKLSFELRRNNPTQAVKYGNAALEIFQKRKIVNGTASAFLNIGTAYLNLSQHHEALDNFNKAISFGEKCNDKKIIARAYNNTGIIFIKQGNTSEAIKNYLVGLKLRQELNDKADIGSSYANIGNVYFKENNFKEALKYYELAIVSYDESGNKFGYANVISNVGNIYQVLGNIDTALYFFKKGLAINLEIRDQRGVSSCYNRMGSAFASQKKYNAAKEYFAMALKIEEETENEEGIAETNKNIAEIDILLKNYSEAERNLIENILILKRIGSLGLLSESYALLSHIDSVKNDFRASLYHYKIHTQYKDSTLNKENTEKIVQQKLTFDFNKKQEEAKREQLKKDILSKEELRQQKIITYISGGAGILVLFFLLISVKAYKEKQKANQVITRQKNEVESQKHLLDVRQKEIVDSINYAKRIQYTLLANEALIRSHLPEHFVLFKPKDIVSGDFYWATEHDNAFYLAACDSTGHGVPGAFMSILNIGFLAEAINEKNITEPNEILNYVRKRLIYSISKDGQQDGFDGILIRYDKTQNIISYAAANNAPVLVRNNKLIELEKDKMPVGKGENSKSFTLHEIRVQKGDSIYLYTDGYADQFGGPKGKKFKYKQLEDILLGLSTFSLSEQSADLNRVFEEWKGKNEQVDDVLMIGIKI